MGEVWYNGTAIYYILQVDEFSLPFVRDMVNSSNLLIVFITYFTVLVQLAFPFLLFNKKTKYLILSMIIPMHIGIAVVMGIVTFSMTMIFIDLLLIGDKDYKKLFSYLRRRFQKKEGVGVAQAEVEIAASADITRNSSATLITFYDSWCPLCTRTKLSMEKMDKKNTIEFFTLRDEYIASAFNINIQKAEQRMLSVDPATGKSYEGIDTLYQICRRIRRLNIFLPFLKISMVLGFGQKTYDFIAKRRMIVPVGQCKDDHCTIKPKP